MTPSRPEYDAVVLAGGRSSRLGGVAKAGLVLDGETLLQRTCAALAGARTVTVVGPRGDATDVVVAGSSVRFVREEPAFAGPAAALAAGFAHDGDDEDDEDDGGARATWCAVVACDMPNVATLIELLLAAAGTDGDTSLVAVDGGREQPLAALYRSEDLARAITSVKARGPLANLSIRSLLASVRTRQVPVPPGTTHDVDTWADARELGIDVP